MKCEHPRDFTPCITVYLGLQLIFSSFRLYHVIHEILGNKTSNIPRSKKKKKLDKRMKTI